MNERIKERISALIDGELSEFEVRRVIEEIESNPELRKYWSSLVIVGQGLKNDSISFVNKDLSEKIAQELGTNLPTVQGKEEYKSNSNYFYVASSLFAGIMLVFSVNIFFPIANTLDESFSDKASQKIAQAIESPGALNLLNEAVSGLDARLERLDSDSEGQIFADYVLPSNGKTFKVSLSPINSSQGLKSSKPSKIAYLNTEKGIFILRVSGDIPPEKKTQILRNINISFNQTQ